ncbi:flagellar assembly protein FliW [Paenibacillaceae bacterium WGS1546]|uniref:flagellar assembly protein FliW n=1 Tax=Cohnella sp. WGS1546 TaxID=3366810 RepID=UPI00372CE85B
MLTIQTRFGEVEYRHERIIQFSAGLPGFEGSKQYILLDVEGHEPFRYLQSLDNRELCFVVVSPFDFFQDYVFDLEDSITEELAMKPDGPVSVYVIVTIRGSLETATANLIAPLVINENERLGKQVILSHPGYTTKHPLFESEERG